MNWSKIKWGIRDPSKIIDFIDSQFLSADPNRLWYGRDECNPDGKPVYDGDWDNLIILDTARYDEFARLNWLDGTLDSWQSLGTQTPQFVSCNFAGETMHDLVVIACTANYQIVQDQEGFEPHYPETVDPRNESSLQQRYFDAGRKGWNMPDPITERARWAANEFSDKRLLIHYFQPHAPYIGETGQKYFDELPGNLADYDSKARQTSRDSDATIKNDDILRQAYRENLEIGLSAVEELLHDLTGKTVVTADHGELLGERVFPFPLKYYGHPPRFYTPELTKVPWFEIETGERKTIRSENPRTYTTAGEDVVEERLRQLGYK